MSQRLLDDSIFPSSRSTSPPRIAEGGDSREIVETLDVEFGWFLIAR